MPNSGARAEVRQQLGRADQRLGRHAAGVQAVAAHAVLLDQRHLGLDRRGDVGRHQPGGTGADDHQIPVEALRLFPVRVHLPRLDQRDDLPGDQREQAEQDEGPQQRGREDALQRVDAGDLSAGVHVDQGPSHHADLADPVESPGADRRQPHRQIDHEKGKDRNQPQGEQIKPAVLRHPGVDRFQLVAEFPLHPVAQHEARDQEGQGGAEGRGEGDDERAPQQTEEGARHQGHDRRARQRQAGDRDVDREEDPRRQGGMGDPIGFDGRLLGLEVVQAKESAQIEGEERADQDGERQKQQELASVHGWRLQRPRSAVVCSINMRSGAVISRITTQLG